MRYRRGGALNALALADIHLLGVLAVGRHLVLAHPPQKLSEEPANRRLFLDVHIRQPGRHAAAQVTLLFQKNQAHTRAGRREGSSNTAGRSGNEDDIRLLDSEGCGDDEKKNEECFHG